MKLTLKNFKCHEDKTYEFSKKLTLIEGVSGQGKSTILNAISFVLYGKIKKPQTYGKSSCFVELLIDNFIIFRGKTPNRLILNIDNKEYLDDSAQDIINKYFGEAFDIISYINQNPVKSFINMSPIEKLDFLESFAFKDINLKFIKDKNKKEILLRKDILNKTLNNLELSNKIFEEFKKPTPIEFPLKGKKNNYDKLTKNEETKLKNCNVRIKKADFENKKIYDEINNIKILLNHISSKEENILKIIENLENINNQKNKINYDGDTKLEEYKEKLSFILKKKELIELKTQYKNNTEKILIMKETELENYNKELLKIENTLWNDYTKIEAEDMLKDLKECLKDSKQITYLKNQIKDCKKDGYFDVDELKNIKEKLEKYRIDLSDKIHIIEKLERQKYIYNCPSCNTKLQFLNDAIFISETQDELDKNNKNIEDIKKDINILKKNINDSEKNIQIYENNIFKINKFEKELNDIISQYDDEIIEENILEDLETMNDYYNTQIKQENKKLDIQNKISDEKFSSSYLIFEKDLKKLKNSIELLEKNNDDFYNINDKELNEEYIRNVIIEQEKYKDTLNRLNSEIITNNKEKIKYENDIDNKKKLHLEKYGSIKDIIELENTINSNKDIIKQNELDKEIHSKNLEKINEYNKFIENDNKYQDFKEKIKNFEKDKIENSKKYEASIKLKEKISEAEAICMFNIIESINSHVQIYLDYFFPDNPIIIKLLSFKENKTNNIKPQINIEVDYKGMECSLDDLSGGELARVNLAYTLALTEIFNCPILLLDECTASLNEELTTMVFDILKENFKDKYVIVVAHQVIEGIFDEIIKI